MRLPPRPPHGRRVRWRPTKGPHGQAVLRRPPRCRLRPRGEGRAPALRAGRPRLGEGVETPGPSRSRSGGGKEVAKTTPAPVVADIVADATRAPGESFARGRPSPRRPFSSGDEPPTSGDGSRTREGERAGRATQPSRSPPPPGAAPPTGPPPQAHADAWSAATRPTERLGPDDRLPARETARRPALPPGAVAIVGGPAPPSVPHPSASSVRLRTPAGRSVGAPAAPRTLPARRPARGDRLIPVSDRLRGPAPAAVTSPTPRLPSTRA